EQLLAKIAGSVAVAPLNILSADVFPRCDHIVLNVFSLCDTNGRAVSDQHEVHTVESILHKALEQERFEFGPLIEKTRRETRRALAPQIDFPTRIAIDNK